MLTQSTLIKHAKYRHNFIFFIFCFVVSRLFGSCVFIDIIGWGVSVSDCFSLKE